MRYKGQGLGWLPENAKEGTGRRDWEYGADVKGMQNEREGDVALYLF